MAAKINIPAVLLKFYPKAKDCLKGHLGPEVVSTELEEDDDRYLEVLVTRCDHCKMPLRSE